MDECLRFLINVDECLNMSALDMFFYKLKNERKFCLKQLQDGSETGFLQAFQDIRVHLNKYPYHCKEYQLIIAMHGIWDRQTPKWEDTMLCRLMSLSRALSSADIDKCALNLFVLCKEDPDAYAAGPSRYLQSDRFRKDAMLLLEAMGIHEAADLKAALKQDPAQSSHDANAGAFLKAFLESPASAEGDLKTGFTVFLKAQFTDYQVVELPLPGNQQQFPRENTYELLRIVDFITRSVERASGTLIEKCSENWDAVKADQALELRYSDMLFVYEQTLQHIHRQLETQTEPAIRNGARLPRDFYERPDGIGNPESVFEAEEDPIPNLTAILDDFLNQKLTVHNSADLWRKTHKKMEADLFDLEDDLRRYADSLSRRYSQRVEKRKKELLRWKSRLFFADDDTEDKLAALESKRTEYLRKLRDPNMTPSLRFEDQDKVALALQQANAEIDHYSDCLHAVNRRNFFGAFGVVLLGTLLHYGFMQPFVFDDTASLTTYVLFLHVTAGGLALSRLVSKNYYRKAIIRCATQLKEKLVAYVPGYFGRAKQFCEYINTLDQLDRTNKLLEVYRDSLKATRSLQRGCLWHKGQIRDHLTKLGAFRGLIDCGSGRSRSCSFNKHKCSTAELVDEQGKIRSIEQCSLYWPQGKGDRE